jgi:3-deoxy-7-phosphoheptulonate synthase
MLVTLRPEANRAAVERELVAHGLWVTRLEGSSRPALWVEPQSAQLAREDLLAIDGVESVAAPASAHPRIDAQPACVPFGPIRLGTGAPAVLIAGPCSVESPEQIRRIAERVAGLGVQLLRGGAFKPRTSPYAFQGHGEAALGWLRDAATAHALGVVTEVMSPADARLVASYADVLQIGSRNMQNFALLRAVAAEGRPILLKRGMSASVEEWLLAGEYCLHHGAPNVVFCERGIRGFDPSTRNLLDLGAVALLAHVHHQPVIVDPSHALGRRDLIPALSRAAIAAGAAGLMLETHDDPGSALSDGPQALTGPMLADLVREVAGHEEAP